MTLTVPFIKSAFNTDTTLNVDKKHRGILGGYKRFPPYLIPLRCFLPFCIMAKLADVEVELEAAKSEVSDLMMQSNPIDH